jgi:hypothetical protein
MQIHGDTPLPQPLGFGPLPPGGQQPVEGLSNLRCNHKPASVLAGPFQGKQQVLVMGPQRKAGLPPTVVLELEVQAALGAGALRPEPPTRPAQPGLPE